MKRAVSLWLMCCLHPIRGDVDWISSISPWNYTQMINSIKSEPVYYPPYDPEENSEKIFLDEVFANNEIPDPTDFFTDDEAFTLYNWDNPDGVAISPRNSSKHLLTLFDPDLETKFVIHGWLGTGNSDVIKYTVEAYLSLRNINMVGIDWGYLAGYKIYPITTTKVNPVAKGLTKMIKKLLNVKATTLRKLHLIGHSLGAHVLGIAGQMIPGKVARITGLDPASPLYEYLGTYDQRLDPGDAEFVDIIHSAGGVAGFYGLLGHADFYPNGGTAFQPGCMELSISKIGCSHARAYMYYHESILNPRGFRAVQCNSWYEFSTGDCDNNTEVYMGDTTSSESRGVFYLTTNSKPPYGQG